MKQFLSILAGLLLPFAASAFVSNSLTTNNNAVALGIVTNIAQAVGGTGSAAPSTNSVVVWHSNGSYSNYTATANTDDARGAALTNAAANVTNNDSFVLGPCNFNTYNFTLNFASVTNVTVRGQSRTTTSITGTNVIFNVGTNGTFSDMTVNGTATTNPLYGMFATVYPATVTGLQLERMNLNCVGTNSGAFNGSCTNSTFKDLYIQSQASPTIGGNEAGGALTFTNSTVTCDSVYITNSCVGGVGCGIMYSASVLTLKNCQVYCSQNQAVLTPDTSTIILYKSILRAYNGTHDDIWSPSGSVYSDSISVFGAAFAAGNYYGVNWLPDERGLITQITTATANFGNSTAASMTNEADVFFGTFGGLVATNDYRLNTNIVLAGGNNSPTYLPNAPYTNAFTTPNSYISQSVATSYLTNINGGISSIQAGVTIMTNNSAWAGGLFATVSNGITLQDWVRASDGYDFLSTVITYNPKMTPVVHGSGSGLTGLDTNGAALAATNAFNSGELKTATNNFWLTTSNMVRSSTNGGLTMTVTNLWSATVSNRLYFTNGILCGFTSP